MLATGTETSGALSMESACVGSRPRVVYLAGSGHTGSTLLALLMSAHPGVATVGEIAVKPKFRHKGRTLRQKCSCGALVGECRFWQSIFQKVNDQGLDFGPAAWTNDYRFTHPLLHRVFTRDSSFALVRAFRGWVERYLPVYRQRIKRIDRVNEAFVRAVLETAGAEVFFDTSKGPMRLARLLASSVFDLRVVMLVRDARAYATSARRRGTSLRDAAETWKKDQLTIRAVTRELPHDRKLLVRYEDLCTNPRGTLIRLHDFCGVAPLELPRQPFSHEHHVLGNNMRMAASIEIRLDERWRSELKDSEQAEVLHIAGALNREFGYQL